MAVQVWTVQEFLQKAGETAEKEFAGASREEQEWMGSIHRLGEKAHGRGDGIAVYVNQDLGHPAIGQWQVVSFGSEESQLETRRVDTTTKREYLRGTYVYGDDLIPTTLPDIGGRINWRYTLEAVVPSDAQQQVVLDKGAASRVAGWVEPENLWEHLQNEHHTDTTGLYNDDLPRWRERHQHKLHGPRRPRSAVNHSHEPCEVRGCVYATGHDVDVFPHRVEAVEGERLVVVQVKVTGDVTAEHALALVHRVVSTGLEQWHDTGGTHGFADDDLGPNLHEAGISTELVDSAVI